MDRQGMDYSSPSSMAYAQQQRQAASMSQQQQQQQQQQQFGFHPQHQQYPSPMQGAPFLGAHPSLQQFPYRHPVQQHPPLPPHPQLLHLQQSSPFPPHIPPPLVHQPFGGPYDSPPPIPAAPPSDPELQKRIDKLVEYIAKNGPEFEAMIREKQKDNPGYSFLFGGEGHNYYHYKFWISTRPPTGHFPPFPGSMMHHPPNTLLNPSPLSTPPMNAAGVVPGASASMLQTHQSPFGSYYEQHQHPQPFLGHARPEYDPSAKVFKGLFGPLPSDVAAELSGVLNSLSGTKDSIKGAKIWFMQRSPFAPALAEALRERVFSLDDSERQLHIIYLANDILFDSLQRRINPHELDNEAIAFKPVLGAMLGRIYHNPHNREENQSRLQKILQFWGSKEVFDRDTINALESEMLSGGSIGAFAGAPQGLSGAAKDPASVMMPQTLNQNILHWQHERQTLHPSDPTHPQFLPGPTFAGSIPITAPPVNPPAEKLPPYPLFPPGLIPGMVKKMQIGSGVPYSPLSPLDIPNVIPPSNISPSETLERVSKFFKEIGEVNPSEGPMRSESRDGEADDDDDDYDREALVRKGGACIPPPPNLQVDPETGTYADGSVAEVKGGSGRLGLGATADPNEVSQYDDVYTSYRKQRSTNYHSSMSARAAVIR